ncbi:cAMP-dependent kinase regulatory subunit-like [Schistosoma japonicum]|nr:cAMP-dependent kinase regulatory subunit-like [Schistosoma japonicum]
MRQPLSKDLVDVLIKPNNLRSTIEIRHIAVWFKENIMAFKDVPIEILMKLVAECKAEFKYPNDVIIREGDIGDCMYVLLSGCVSVHYRGDQSNATNENDLVETYKLLDDESNHTFEINHDLGPQVGQLEAGSVFGEVALIEDCLRTASIIALPINNVELHKQEHDNQQLLSSSSSTAAAAAESFFTNQQSVCLVNISRRLYNITVRNQIEQEFHERIKGELRISLHDKSFRKSKKHQYNSSSGKYNLPFITGSNPNSPEKTGSLCIGDLEFLLKYPKYLFSVISNASITIIYFMDKHNAERYLLGYYSKSIHYQSPIHHLTLYEFIQLVELRLISIIKYVPNNLKNMLFNAFNELLKIEEDKLKHLLHFKVTNSKFNLTQSKLLMNSFDRNKFKEELLNNSYQIYKSTLKSMPKVSVNYHSNKNEMSLNALQQSVQDSINKFNTVHTKLNMHFSMLQANYNELKEIVQLNSLPYEYRVNAGRLLQQFNNQQLQIKIQNFIKDLNDFKVKQSERYHTVYMKH